MQVLRAVRFDAEGCGDIRLPGFPVGMQQTRPMGCVLDYDDGKRKVQSDDDRVEDGDAHGDADLNGGRVPC